MSSRGTSNCCNCFNEFDSACMPFDIYTAASIGDLAYFKNYDVRKLARIISKPNKAGWTPLMYACARGHSELVNYLLRLGASRNSRSTSGVTPLMLAVSSADVSTVDIVFDFSNLEDRDYRKWTPLFYAIHYGREKCLLYLLSRGANVNIVDFENETPLMKAIKLGMERMVEELLKTANNLDVVSYKQESAIMLAEESKNAKIQNLVRQRYEYLRSCQKTSLQNCDCKNVTPVNGSKKRPKSPVQHCSPTPIKQQFKIQYLQMKAGKTLTYSPNKKPSISPLQTPKAKPGWDPIKSFAKKFWSPQLRPHNDVESFLKSLGLEKYWPIFRDEEVDFETLLTLNEQNLMELGIKFPFSVLTMTAADKIVETSTSYLVPGRKFILGYSS